ncbi:hypothetical protein ROHU_018220 [Labeo rohita]|uniref:Uncharacterized protein n=1 Tax=Labeo rohita TaxID=84645 RepID=A0A498L7S9_LABRO|nr:hypothetical protein ROHU_034728 [Labeo rohita]RXN29870.1 hypothetical protein ROHU_018220 [Labeo rohita]
MGRRYVAIGKTEWMLIIKMDPVHKILCLSTIQFILGKNILMKLSRNVTPCSSQTWALLNRKHGATASDGDEGNPGEEIGEAGEPSHNHGDLRSTDLIIQNGHGHHV